MKVHQRRKNLRTTSTDRLSVADSRRLADCLRAQLIGITGLLDIRAVPDQAARPVQQTEPSHHSTRAFCSTLTAGDIGGEPGVRRVTPPILAKPPEKGVADIASATRKPAGAMMGFQQIREASAAIAVERPARTITELAVMAPSFGQSGAPRLTAEPVHGASRHAFAHPQN
jgi:hypothetical protein